MGTVAHTINSKNKNTMAFQFKNIESGKIYTLNEIDEIIAKFWGKEVHPKEYAYPGEPLEYGIHKPNWFDMLGHSIEDLQFFHWFDENDLPHYRRAYANDRNAEFSMQEVASLMLNDLTRYCDSADKMIMRVTSLRPYIEVCFHLRSLNIVGVGCGW